jgi:hypothetical protein
MALESVTNIADLVRTNPTGADPKSAGDDHLRNIKTALLNDIVGYAGAVTVSGTDGGAVNAYTVTPAYGTLVAYGTRMLTVFSPTITNTGASTLNISALGVKNILSVSGAALVAGDLVAGNLYAAFYNGTEFRLLSVTQQYVVQQAFSAALPAQSLGLLISDGTVASFSKTLTGFPVNEVKGADIASATTVDISVATGNFVHITGTTTITGITLGVGAERTVIFDSALTLTHGAGLLLPGASNIVTAANDRMKVRGDTAGVIVTNYTRANGAPVKGGLTLLATLTPTAAATVDFLSTFTSDYDNYIIFVDGVKPAADDTFRARFANAGTADSGSNYWGANHAANATSAGTDLWSGTGSATTSAGKGLSYALTVMNANDATNGKVYSASGRTQSAATPTYAHTDLSGMYVAANAISGIRFYWSAGNNFQATGRIRVYGYNHQ